MAVARQTVDEIDGKPALYGSQILESRRASRPETGPRVSVGRQALAFGGAEEPQPLPPVPARLHMVTPVPVVEVPAHRRAQPGLEVVVGRPPELDPEARRVDRVAPVVAG